MLLQLDEIINDRDNSNKIKPQDEIIEEKIRPLNCNKYMVNSDTNRMYHVYIQNISILSKIFGLDYTYKSVDAYNIALKQAKDFNK